MRAGRLLTRLLAELGSLCVELFGVVGNVHMLSGFVCESTGRHSRLAALGWRAPSATDISLMADIAATEFW